MDGDFPIGKHIEWLAGHSRVDLERLTSALVGRTWPGGQEDRSETAALEWVKRWRARGAQLAPLVCECATGRCSVCN